MSVSCVSASGARSTSRSHALPIRPSTSRTSTWTLAPATAGPRCRTAMRLTTANLLWAIG